MTVRIELRTGETLVGDTETPLCLVARTYTDYVESVTEFTDKDTVYGVELLIAVASKPETMHSNELEVVEMTSQVVPSLNAIYVLSVIESNPVPSSVNISPPS